MKNKVLGSVLIILILVGVVISIIYSAFGSGFRPKANVAVSVNPADITIDAQELVYNTDGNLADVIEQPEEESVDTNQSSDIEEESTNSEDEEITEIEPEEVEFHEDTSIEGDAESDISMDLITEENYEMLVFLTVTDGLFDEYEALLSDSFKESYDSFFDAKPFSDLKGVREIDTLFGNFNDKIVTVVVDGVSYTFEYTVDSTGLLDSIKNK